MKKALFFLWVIPALFILAIITFPIGFVYKLIKVIFEPILKGLRIPAVWIQEKLEAYYD